MVAVAFRNVLYILFPRPNLALDSGSFYPFFGVSFCSFALSREFCCRFSGVGLGNLYISLLLLQLRGEAGGVEEAREYDLANNATNIADNTALKRFAKKRPAHSRLRWTRGSAHFARTKQ